MARSHTSAASVGALLQVGGRPRALAFLKRVGVERLAGRQALAGAVSHALKAGANGFVPKHSQRSVFRRAFEAVGRGEPFVPDGYIDPREPESGAGPDDALARLATLTNQQARILSLICEGKLNKQIAYDLTIAETTVKAHVTAIMRKLGVHSRTQAVLIAQEANFNRVLPSEGAAP